MEILRLLMSEGKPGRPRGTTKQDNRKSLTIRLPVDVIKQLPATRDKGRWIEQAIRQKLATDSRPTAHQPPQTQDA